MIGQRHSGGICKIINARVGMATVQEYIKQLHRRFNVSSRGELLALFIGQ